MTQPDPRLVAALQAHQSGDLLRAAAGYRALLHVNPAHFEALQLLAVICQSQGQAAEALALISRAITLDPRQPVLFFNRALALAALGRIDEALLSVDASLRLARGTPAVRSLRAGLLGQLGRHAESAIEFATLCAEQPDQRDFAIGHANALLQSNQLEAALQACEQALQRHPASAELLNLRGVVHSRLLQPEAAIAAYRAALTLAPDFTLANANLGRSLMALQRLGEAIQCFERVIHDDPADANAHFSRACCRLALGELPQAWAEFEWRRRLPGGIDLTRRFERPRWLGRSSVQGKRLLLCAEQGYGDAIQFIRFVPQLEAMGAHVVVELRRPLDPLLRQISTSAEWFPAGDSPPPHDLVCSMISLGRALALDWPQISGQAYLRADARCTALWQERLGLRRAGRKRIALVWRGNPGHVNDHERSLSLQALQPLLALDAEWFSVQKTLTEADRAFMARNPHLRSLDDGINGLDDTAAILANVDLLISVDGGVAHLGGALGVPTWILLPFNTDWRWLQARTDSPWYDSVRLFRQSAPGDWSAVLADVRSMLDADPLGQPPG